KGGAEASLYFAVYAFSCGLRVGSLARIVRSLGIIERHVADLLVHTIDGDHAVGHLGNPLEVGEGTGGYLSENNLFCGSSSKRHAHSVNHLLRLVKELLLRKVLCVSECGYAAGHNADLNKRVGVFQE